MSTNCEWCQIAYDEIVKFKDGKDTTFLAAVRGLIEAITLQGHIEWQGCCRFCGSVWPCKYAEALAHTALKGLTK